MRQPVSHANKDESVEQLLRHELILGLLPSKDSALDSNAIHQRVANQGIQVDKRTIQRDLSELEQKFPGLTEEEILIHAIFPHEANGYFAEHK